MFTWKNGIQHTILFFFCFPSLYFSLFTLCWFRLSIDSTENNKRCWRTQCIHTNFHCIIVWCWNLIDFHLTRKPHSYQAKIKEKVFVSHKESNTFSIHHLLFFFLSSLLCFILLFIVTVIAPLFSIQNKRNGLSFQVWYLQCELCEWW